MFVNLRKFNRSEIGEKESVFFQKAAPLAKLIKDWSRLKAHFKGIRSTYGIFASLTLANILFLSEFGSHPLAQKKYGSHVSNNLMLVRSNIDWAGDIISFNGVDYKSYENWRDFATDISDIFAFSGNYDKALQVHSQSAQLSTCPMLLGTPINYNEVITSLIERYGLTEFDNLYGR
mgnify:CR=1 FL=1